MLYLPNIKFGNIDFSGDGAYIWGAGEYSAPTRSVDFIEVPGRNGDLVVDNGNYNNNYNNGNYNTGGGYYNGGR